MLDERFLDRLFEQHRGRCYEGKLTFPTIVQLIKDALIVHEGSGRACFQRARDEDRLPSTLRAVYDKLARIPLRLSMALLRDATARLQHVLPPSSSSSTPCLPPPASLCGFASIVLDGKTIKHVSRQLKALRDRRGRVNSGKMLVALSLQSGLAVAFNGSADSECNDVSLVDGVLEQLLPPPPPRQKDEDGWEIRLFTADRQFCDLPRLLAFSERGDHFLVRHNRNLHFHADEARGGGGGGTDEQGRRFVQEWGWLGAAQHPLRRYVRRVTLFRPGGDDEDVSIVTDLLDERAYPAADLLLAYLQRWGHRAGVPAGDRGVRPEEPDRRPSQRHVVPSVLLPPAVQRHPGGADVRRAGGAEAGGGGFHGAAL